MQKKKRGGEKEYIESYWAAQSSSASWTLRLGKWPGGSVSSHQARNRSDVGHKTSLCEDVAASRTDSRTQLRRPLLL